MADRDEPADEEKDLEDYLTEITALLVLGAGLTALFLGYSWFWLVFVIGFAVVLPLVSVVGEAVVARYRSTSRRTPDPYADERADALEVLRERYARGQLSEDEFERRVERLVETETVADATKWARRMADGERARERE